MDSTNEEMKEANREKMSKKGTIKMEDINPMLNKTVDDMYQKIDSYMRIVRKTARDMVPKAITFFVINALQDYISDKLMMDFLGLPTDEYVSQIKLWKWNYVTTFIFLIN